MKTIGVMMLAGLAAAGCGHASVLTALEYLVSGGGGTASTVSDGFEPIGVTLATSLSAGFLNDQNPADATYKELLSGLGVNNYYTWDDAFFGSGNLIEFDFYFDGTGGADGVLVSNTVTVADLTTAGNQVAQATYNGITATLLSTGITNQDRVSGDFTPGRSSDTLLALDIAPASAIPEPGTLALFGVGFCFGMFLRRVSPVACAFLHSPQRSSGSGAGEK